MKKLLLTFSVLLCTMAVMATPITRADSIQIVGLNLPVVYINTVAGEEPTCEPIYPPEGAGGVGSTNANKVGARMVIMRGGQTIYDSGEYVKKTSGLTIKTRGNTSALLDKKGFKLKLEKKADLLFGDEIQRMKDPNVDYRDKEWALMASTTTIRNLVGMWTNEAVGMPFVPKYQFVNLFINGDYRGLYQLSELVKVNPLCRVNIDEANGYIIEYDAYWWHDEVYFSTDYLGDGRLRYVIKYPEDEELTDAKQAYIADWFNHLEENVCYTVSAKTHYDQWLDVKSFARWLLAHDMIGDVDNAGSNLYFFKNNEEDSSKVMMGPMWDFDSAMDLPGVARIHNTYLFAWLLWCGENEQFAHEYIKMYNDLSDTIIAHILQQADDLGASSMAEAITKSRKYNAMRWDLNGYSTLAKNIKDLHAYYAGKKEAMSEDIENICHAHHWGVSGSMIIDAQGQFLHYDLLGRVVAEDAPGIHIVNRQKIWVR